MNRTVNQLTLGLRTFFSVSRSQRRILQIWWLLSFRQGAQSPQLSFFEQPVHSPQRFRFFLFPFSFRSWPAEWPDWPEWPVWAEWPAWPVRPWPFWPPWAPWAWLWPPWPLGDLKSRAESVEEMAATC